MRREQIASLKGFGSMIDFYYWPTPNGWKVSIMLEETGLPYKLMPVNIGKGDQFKPEFMAISPNDRMPAIVDHDDAGRAAADLRIRPDPAASGGEVRPVHADRSARAGRRCLEWLFWQVGNLGPMAGQLSHFVNYAQGEHALFEAALCQRVQSLPGRVGTAADRARDYILGDAYSIADMISWPWVLISKPLGQALDEFPNVSRWRDAIKQRPAVQRGVDVGKDLRRTGQRTEEERQLLFNQTARSVAEAAR